MLFLVFLIGFFILSRITLKHSLLEKIGFALPTGLAVITVFMVLLDWMNIGLNRTSMTTVTIVALVGAIALNIKHFRNLTNITYTYEHGWFNFLWLAMLGVVVYLEYINFTKCMIYPVYDRDSLAAFDTIGYICAQEHTFHAMSIFDPSYFPHMHEAGSSISYLPMVQLSYAYVYIFGAATSKAIPAFVYLGFLFGFYGLCKRRMTHTSAMLVILGIVSAPEMLSFASLSVTNVMQACMASAGIVYVCLWYRSGNSSDLRMAILMLAINNWMRAEGVVFIGAAWLLVIAKCISKKKWKQAVWPALALCPLVLWMVYSNTCGLTAESAIITHPFWDAAKADTIWKGAWKLFSEGTYYGWTFNIFLIVLIVHFAVYSCKISIYETVTDGKRTGGIEFPKVNKKKDFGFVMPVALIICVIGYYLILYQVDYKWDSIDNVLAYSAKRFNFCFVPIAWYYVGASLPVNKLFSLMEQYIGLGKKTKGECKFFSIEIVRKNKIPKK